MTYSKKELIEIVEKMKAASSAFYANAVAIGNHPFIEFTGLMNEYIKICHRCAQQGIDFTKSHIHSGVPMPIEPFEAEYIGDKFGCVFGPTLNANGEAMKMFLAAAGLQESQNE